MAFTKDDLKIILGDSIRFFAEKKAIKRDMVSKYDAYNLLRMVFQSQHEAGKSVLVRGESGNWKFSDVANRVYQVAMEKLEEIDGSEIDIFEFKDEAKLKTEGSIKREGNRIKREADRVRSIMKKIMAEQDRFSYAGMSDAALEAKAKSQMLINRGRLFEGAPLVNVGLKTSRGYRLDTYTTAMRGVLLRKSGFHNQDLSTMSDEDVIKNYEKYRRSLVRFGKANDIIKSQLLSDPNYQTYLEEEKRMTLKTGLQIAKINVGKAIKSISNSPIAQKLGNFFTDNKMLRIIEGYDKIPDKYMSEAADNLIAAFKAAEASSAATSSTSTPPVSGTPPVGTPPVGTPPVVEAAPTAGETPPGVASTEEEHKVKKEPERTKKEGGIDAAYADKVKALYSGLKRAPEEGKPVVEGDTSSPVTEGIPVDVGEKTPPAVVHSFVRKGREGVGGIERVEYKIESINDSKIKIKEVKATVIHPDAVTDDEKAQVIDGTAIITIPEGVIDGVTEVKCVVDHNVTDSVYELVTLDSLSRQRDFGIITGVTGTLEKSTMEQSVENYNNFATSRVTKLSDSQKIELSPEQEEVQTLMREGYIDDYRDYVNPDGDNVVKYRVKEFIKNHQREYNDSIEGKTLTVAEQQQHQFSFYYQERERERASATAVANSHFEHKQKEWNAKTQFIYVGSENGTHYYQRYIEKDGEFIICQDKEKEETLKSKGIKPRLTKQMQEAWQERQTSGEVVLKGKKGEVTFVVGSGVGGVIPYQPLDEFKMSTTYLATELMSGEFLDYIKGDTDLTVAEVPELTGKKGAPKVAGAEEKSVETNLVELRRGFVDAYPEKAKAVVQNYSRYCSSSKEQAFVQEIIQKYAKEYKRFVKDSSQKDQNILAFSFAREKMKTLEPAELSEISVASAERLHEKDGMSLVEIDDSNHKKNKPIVVNGEKFYEGEYCFYTNAEGQTIKRMTYESKKHPGLVVFGREIEGLPVDEADEFKKVDGQITIDMGDKTFVATTGVLGETKYITLEEYEKIKAAEAKATSAKAIYVASPEEEYKDEHIEEIPESEVKESERTKEGRIDAAYADEVDALYNGLERAPEEEPVVEGVTSSPVVEGDTSSPVTEGISPEGVPPEGVGEIENKEKPVHVAAEESKKIPQPTGIADLARDAMWEDIYQTVVASGDFLDKNGNSKVGRLTAMLIGVASDNEKLNPGTTEAQEFSTKVRDVLITTYKNHAMKALLDNKGKEGAPGELKAELEALGIDYKDEWMQKDADISQVADKIANAKFNYYMGIGLTNRGWARHALFELSQARYNVNTGEQDPRRESRFYRVLRDADLEFDIETYETNIKGKVEDQVNKSLNNSDGKDKAVISIDGKDVEVIVVEINGVKCYVADGKIIETETIIQNENPLVKKEEVVGEVVAARTKERKENIVTDKSANNDKYRGKEEHLEIRVDDSARVR